MAMVLQVVASQVTIILFVLRDQHDDRGLFLRTVLVRVCTPSGRIQPQQGFGWTYLASDSGVVPYSLYEYGVPTDRPLNKTSAPKAQPQSTDDQ